SELQPDPEHRDLGGRMLVTPRCKYCAFSEGARPELLFDLAADPGETHNLATDPDHATALLEHRRLLREWMSAHGDPLALPTLQQG
ncbi:MAG: choline-sulfatase, partial [Chloroflexi bacterium]|nr:choline-sulfatase [Chloroflexota bacterium]